MIAIERWDGDATAWNDFVARDPAGGFTHLAEWLAIMSQALGHEPLAWTARAEDGTLEGLLPLVRVRSPLFGHYLVSMPFLNAGGPLGTPRACTALVTEAVEEARRSRADLLELRTRGAPLEGLTISERKITHTLPLPADPTLLWDALPAKLRTQIRRPQREGFTVTSGVGECDAFYDVFARHMRVLGTPVLPRAWFTAVAAAFGDQVMIVVVRDGEVPIAAGFGFAWRGVCEITWASARREWSRAAPNMLLYWAFLQEAIARGAGIFDFGRCTPGSGTHAFKRQWGGTDLPLAWGQWRAGAIAATPSPERPIFRLAAACWSRLPLAVTNRLGPPLARCLP